MPDAVVPASLQNVRGADHVAVDVGVWVLDRIPHAGLRAEVDHPLELLLRKELRHPGAVGEIELHEAERWLLLEQREASLLEPDVVVVVQVVEADDGVAAREQL